MEYLELLKRQFNNRIDVVEKRPSIKQIMLPFFHEDGDLIEVYIDEKIQGADKIRICDFGKTLMRLSYSYDLSSEYRINIFEEIINENDLNVENGNIYIDIEPNRIYGALLQFVQVVSKVTSMQYFSREYFRSMFYEALNEFIDSTLKIYSFERNYLPIKDHDEFEVDYKFNSTQKPIFLFGISDKAKARLVGWMCSEFLRENISFRSVAIHEDFENLSKMDRKRITNIVDKQFTNREEFEEHAIVYLNRELSQL